MSRVMQLPFALFAFFGFVAILPVWGYFLNTYGPGLTTEAEFIAGMVLPMMLLLFIASWLQPRGGLGS
jgi:hypothetical protein